LKIKKESELKEELKNTEKDGGLDSMETVDKPTMDDYLIQENRHHEYRPQMISEDLERSRSDFRKTIDSVFNKEPNAAMLSIRTGLRNELENTEQDGVLHNLEKEDEPNFDNNRMQESRHQYRSETKSEDFNRSRSRSPAFLFNLPESCMSRSRSRSPIHLRNVRSVKNHNEVDGQGLQITFDNDITQKSISQYGFQTKEDFDRPRSRSPMPRSNLSQSRKSRSRSPIHSRNIQSIEKHNEEDGYRLRVANLNSKANKHELERIFGKYGPLKKIQISRAVPRFALVVFHFQEDAEEAQRKANGSQVFGCYIKVTFARPFTLRHGYQSYNPCLKCGKCGEYGHLLRDCQAKIVIKKELEDVDREWHGGANVLEKMENLALDKDMIESSRCQSRSRSRSQDRERFRSRSPAQLSIKSQSCDLRSRLGSPVRQRQILDNKKASGFRLHVANLNSKVDINDIERIFCQYGPLKEIWMARSSPCFAFVVFRYRKNAEEAKQETDRTKVCGGYIRVTFARRRTHGRGPGQFDSVMRCFKRSYESPPSPR